MKPLPMPLRLAAGLVATAIEEAQELPRKLVELPVTAVSQVLQASMRMQQRVTELAIKGDQALGGLRPVPETPTWARFDEDENDPPYGGGGGSFGGGTGHPFGNVDRPYGGGNGVSGASSDTDWNVPPPRSAPRTVSPIRIAREPEPGALAQFDEDEDEFEDLEFTEANTNAKADAPLSRPDPSSTPSSGTKSQSKPSATKPSSAKPSTAKPPTKPPSKPSAGKPASNKTTKSDAKGAKSAKPDKSDNPTAVEKGPKGHEDYPSWTLPQLRGRFRSLELADVQALLVWETSHLDRPPYVTMLSNRIASITGR